MAANADSAYDLKPALPLAAFFAALFLAPLVILIFVSLHTDTSMAAMGLTQYAKFPLDPFSLSVLARTLWIGVEVTALCLQYGGGAGTGADAADGPAPDHRPFASRSESARRVVGPRGGHWRTFRKVILPLTFPGIIAGCLLYAATITAFITQTLVGGG